MSSIKVLFEDNHIIAVEIDTVCRITYTKIR